MVRNNRYVVFKISDINKYLSNDQIQSLKIIENTVNDGRIADGKAAFSSVVVEHDWPEFESVWHAIGYRVDSQIATNTALKDE